MVKINKDSSQLLFAKIVADKPLTPLLRKRWGIDPKNVFRLPLMICGEKKQHCYTLQERVAELFDRFLLL
jgi:hypothetical protein